MSPLRVERGGVQGGVSRPKDETQATVPGASAPTSFPHTGKRHSCGGCVGAAGELYTTTLTGTVHLLTCLRAHKVFGARGLLAFPRRTQAPRPESTRVSVVDPPPCPPTFLRLRVQGRASTTTSSRCAPGPWG